MTLIDSVPHDFSAVDDDLHAPGASFYENETYWFSFFVPERRWGAWLYAGVRQNATVTHGGMWVWDDTSGQPWEAPFYEQFQHLKLPTSPEPGLMVFPTGLTVRVVEPLMSYDLAYDDRDRITVRLRFAAVEPPVPLRAGAPPYPKAHHFDQIGRVTGTVELDGEVTAIDSYAMRDRSWGPRVERGYQRIGYTWIGGPDLSVLSYTAPKDGRDDVYTGYLRRDGRLARLTSGTRSIERGNDGSIACLELEVEDELGRRITARGEALSRLALPHASVVTWCTAMRWTVEGHTLFGEDQDVWPVSQWRRRPWLKP
ncbi:MAG: hypothetical protein JWP74_2626 [Marmoricola sp.]|nr:hypothetical protein [Marmoricola sp.]